MYILSIYYICIISGQRYDKSIPKGGETDSLISYAQSANCKSKRSWNTCNLQTAIYFWFNINRIKRLNDFLRWDIMPRKLHIDPKKHYICTSKQESDQNHRTSSGIRNYPLRLQNFMN